MISAIDVARFFALNTRHPNTMTNMRLNKLAYYAQAWSLIRLKRPLFPDDVEAWTHGPVIPSIYHAYKRFDTAPVPVPEDTSFLNRFSDDEVQLLLDVLREYDEMSTWQLRNLSHSEGEPWITAYHPGQNHIKIEPGAMVACFRKFDPLPLIDPLAALPVVDALPADWDDPAWEEYAPQ